MTFWSRFTVTTWRHQLLLSSDFLLLLCSHQDKFSPSKKVLISVWTVGRLHHHHHIRVALSPFCTLLIGALLVDKDSVPCLERALCLVSKIALEIGISCLPFCLLTAPPPTIMTQTFWWNRKMPIRVFCIGYCSLLFVFFQGPTDAFGILPRVVTTNEKTCLAAVPAPNSSRRNLDLLLDRPPQSHTTTLTTTTTQDKDEEPTKRIYNNINNESPPSPSSSSFGMSQKVIKSLVSLGVACSLAVMSLPTSAVAVSDSASLLVGQQYWTIMNQEGACQRKKTAKQND